MKNTENRRYEMLLRVQEFGAAHRDVFPGASPGGQAFAALSTVVQHLGTQAVSKLSAAREGRRAKDAAREAVLERLEAIGRCARVIARETAGFGEEFQMGRTRSNQAILTTGRLFTQEAPKFQEQFVASGMPETFVSDLTALLDGFERSVRKWEAGRGGHAAARASIESNLSSALTILGKLDLFVANQFHDDAATTAMWERIRKVELPRRVRRRGSAVVVVSEPAVTAAPDVVAPPAAPEAATPLAGEPVSEVA
jgi:hypothetical protein